MAAKLELMGKKFNRLTVLYKDETHKGTGGTKWICQCECGKIKSILGSNLVSNKTKSCGCLQKEIASNMYKDLLGQVFGKLTVIEKTERRQSGSNIIWKCQCECGNITEVAGYDLTSGHTSSCGCIRYSIGETKIADILTKNNIVFEREKTFSDFVFEDTTYQPRYDFYLPDYNRLIEFDGVQHFSNYSTLWSSNGKFERRKYSDNLKNEYALNHNIELVRIPYWMRDKITIELLLGEKYLI